MNICCGIIDDQSHLLTESIVRTDPPLSHWQKQSSLEQSITIFCCDSAPKRLHWTESTVKLNFSMHFSWIRLLSSSENIHASTFTDYWSCQFALNVFLVSISFCVWPVTSQLLLDIDISIYPFIFTQSNIFEYSEYWLGNECDERYAPSHEKCSETKRNRPQSVQIISIWRRFKQFKLELKPRLNLRQLW